MTHRSLCYVSGEDFRRFFPDVEPIAICPGVGQIKCGRQISTAWERCAACQAKHDENEHNNAADPRRW